MIVYQCLSVAPKRWYTPFYQYVLPSILCLFYTFFVIFAGKTKESLEKVDFDQRTACGAPIRWSKYTTNGLWQRVLSLSLPIKMADIKIGI